MIRNQNKTFAWIPLEHNLFGYVLFSFEKIVRNHSNGRFMLHNCNFKFNWKPKPNSLKMAEKKKILLKALIEYFVDKKKLIDKNNERMTFTNEYKYHHYKLGVPCCHIDIRFIRFLKFINILDDRRLNELCIQFNKVRKLNLDPLKQKSQHFLSAQNDLRKNRFNDILCFNSNILNFNGYDFENIPGFIYNNEIKNQNKCFAYFSTNVKDMKTKRYTNKPFDIVKNYVG
ncbi:Hypothetical protein SRAE_2000136800 [Strongyloides ratti]|uniref:DUF7585 domain-containing protein n=1 Tax=Strongyloides ratti TaxID=34506 RepID=A0A090LAC8_STRRB|nr:Hypothetical protein SRAE_2000136800 [Strongyloides ratti]CEF66701.1 Hypothetical protein SRAE_2000136800 [Strongyloides ratti]